MRNPMATFLVAALAAVLLAGCGAGGGKISANPLKDEITVTNDKGEKVNIQAKEGKLPEGFPLAVYKGATIDSSLKTTSNGKGAYTVTLKVKAAAKDVADFYEKALTDKGIKVDRSELSSDGEEMFSMAGESDKLTAWITVTKKSDQQETEVLLVIGDK